MREHHLIKHGFRYFWQENGTDCFSQRAEFGLSEYYPFHSYQLDRGRFENDLCRMNIELGVQVIDQVSVTDITIHETQLHEVHYKHLPSKESQIVRGRWVIDAMGRRCFLQKKFGLQIKSDTPRSAVWFRVKGRLDVADLVPESALAWHQRVPNRMRYYSTSHLMGPGYWIWLIPLSSGYTSVGIVTSEEFHPFSTYSTYDRAMAWLAQNDPMLRQKIQEHEIVDFLKVRNYTYSSQQVFSEQRWGCVGNAALFSDPFYSPGAIVIAYENSCLTRMIGLDLQNELTKSLVSSYDKFIISVNDGLAKQVQDLYYYFDNSQVFSLSFLWGTVVGWGLDFPKMRHSLYLDPDKGRQIDEILSKSYSLVALVDRLFLEWSAKSRRSFTFEFLDYRRIPFIGEIHARQTKKYTSFEQIKENYQYAKEKVEEFAQVIFLLMIEDIMPEKLALFPEPIWLNAWAMSLHPDKWQEDGLFEPNSERRDLKDMMSQTRALYSFKDD